jgi:hypothetical protein
MQCRPPSTHQRDLAPDPLAPARILDTRDGVGASGPVARGHWVSVTVGGGSSGHPASGVGAVVLNVTVTGATAGGFETVYPDGIIRPGTSNLNFTAGQTVPSLVLAPVGADGKVDLYVSSVGRVQLIADVSGYTVAGIPSGVGGLGPLSPTRILDTRHAVGAAGPIAGGQWVSLVVEGGNSGVPAYGVAAVILNVTVTGATATGYLTVYPDGFTRPDTSNLNFTAGQTVPNLVLAPVSATGIVNFYVSCAGVVHIVADVSGYLDR